MPIPGNQRMMSHHHQGTSDDHQSRNRFACFDMHKSYRDCHYDDDDDDIARMKDYPVGPNGIGIMIPTDRRYYQYKWYHTIVPIEVHHHDHINHRHHHSNKIHHDGYSHHHHGVVTLGASDGWWASCHNNKNVDDNKVHDVDDDSDDDDDDSIGGLKMYFYELKSGDHSSDEMEYLLQNLYGGGWKRKKGVIKLGKQYIRSKRIRDDGDDDDDDDDDDSILDSQYQNGDNSHCNDNYVNINQNIESLNGKKLLGKATKEIAAMKKKWNEIMFNINYHGEDDGKDGDSDVNNNGMVIHRDIPYILTFSSSIPIVHINYAEGCCQLEQQQSSQSAVNIGTKGPSTVLCDIDENSDYRLNV